LKAESLLKFYDVILVGAGPAGCSAALCLAKMGYNVLLVEEAKFPRDKVCGDGIGPATLEVLDRLGMIPRIMERDPWRIDEVQLSSPAGHVVAASFSHLKGPYRHGLVMPRREFDLLLWQQVQTFSKVHALEDCRVMDLVYGNGGVEGVRVKRGGVMEEFRGKAVIGADGVYSLVAKKLFRTRRAQRGYAFGVRAYYRQVEGLTHRIEIHFPKSTLPGYGWIFPLGKDTANVGIGVSSRFLKEIDIRALFRTFLGDTPRVRDRLKKAVMVENSFGGWPIPLGKFFPRRSCKNVLLIGDAGGFADALTGEGIYYALRSGECAAETLQGLLGLDGGVERAGAVYERLWKKAFNRKEYLIGSVIQRLVTREAFLNFNIRRAVQKPIMAQNLASILCHQKSKIGLLL
jgi:geranylgeranyl reductase family protein